MKDYWKGCENSFIRKHMLKEHHDKVHEARFEWKVLRKFDKPLQRQLTEAINIESKSAAENLNSKKKSLTVRT